MFFFPFIGVEFIFFDHSKPDPLHLVLGEPFLCPVVKLGRARALVRGHFLRVLERTAVGEIGGDAGRAKRVATDFSLDAGRQVRG